MPDETLLDEAGEVLASHQWGEGPWTIHSRHNFSADCKVCQGDTEAMAAVMLRVVEKRFRKQAERYRQAGPKQTTLGAQWSATQQAIEWDHIADMIAEGLPTEEVSDVR